LDDVRQAVAWCGYWACVSPIFSCSKGENNACDFYAEPPIGWLISIFPGENGLPFAVNQFLQLRLEPGFSNDCSLFIDLRDAL
jgi:hypothetical protein